jgi:hypothetical protein
MTCGPPPLAFIHPSRSWPTSVFFQATNGRSAAIDATWGQPFPLVLSDPGGNGRWGPATARDPITALWWSAPRVAP